MRRVVIAISLLLGLILLAVVTYWLVSPEGQKAIAAYKIDGQQLFFPNAAGSHDARSAARG